MKKLGRNSLALGLVTLLITTAMSFAFTAQADHDAKAYAEAQTIAAIDEALGLLLDPLADALEDSGSYACEGYDEQIDCSGDNPAFTTSPLQALNALTVPLGDALGGEIGPVSNYAIAQDGASRAASGAVGSDGIVNVGGGGTDAPMASLDLLGDTLDGIAGVELQIGAVSAWAELDSPSGTIERGYDIAQLSLVIDAPAIEALLGEVESVLGQSLTQIESIGLSTVCGLLDGALQILCSALGDNVLEIGVPSIDQIMESISATTDEGISIDLSSGIIEVDLDAILGAAGLDLNNLDPSTDLLPYIVEALDDVIANVNSILLNSIDGIVSTILSNLSVTVLGLDLGPLLTAITEAVTDLASGILGTLEDTLGEIELPLAGLVGADLLGQVAQILVNVPDVYADAVSDRLPTDPNAGDYGSNTALQINLLGGDLANLLLANALVGPNAEATDHDQDDDAVQDDDGDDAIQDDADAISDSDRDGPGTVSDADAVADADAVDTLPQTGAPNLLPLWLLALALILFGTGVLLNERRRMVTAEL